MYGTLRGALAGRRIPFDADSFTATAEGRIAGPNATTIRILSIHVRYDLTIPPEHRAATERALRVHPAGCPVHASLQAAIPIRWSATLRLGDETVLLDSDEERHGDET
jgi:uncharacterized OsmC-like protein